MPIGTQTPGVLTTVTPDTTPALYTSTQGPAPDGLVVADDVLACHLIALNVQKKAQIDLAPVISGLASVTSELTSLINAFPGKALEYRQAVDLYNGTTIIPVASSGFVKSQSYGRTSWVQSTSLVDGDGVAFFVSHLLPKSGGISLVRAYGRGNGHSALPAELPWVQLCRISANAEASTDMTVIGTGVDASESAAEFDELHYIGCTQNLPHTIDHGYEYHIRIRGERGANAQVGFRFSFLQLVIVP